jgi:hypothetical protein
MDIVGRIEATLPEHRIPILAQSRIAFFLQNRVFGEYEINPLHAEIESLNQVVADRDASYSFMEAFRTPYVTYMPFLLQTYK